MHLTPEGPTIAPAPLLHAFLNLRRVAVAGPDYVVTSASIASFRDWVSENTGYPTDCIFLVTNTSGARPSDKGQTLGLGIDAYVLVGDSYHNYPPSPPRYLNDRPGLDPHNDTTIMRVPRW